jgi:hypothetical protein
VEALRLARILLALLEAGLAQVWAIAEEEDIYYYVIDAQIICIKRAELIANGGSERPFFVAVGAVDVLILPLTEAWDICNMIIGRAVQDPSAVAKAKRQAFDTLLLWLEAKT